MTAAAPGLIAALWIALGLYWAVAAGDVKATLRRETRLQRLSHVGPLLLCAALLAFPRLLPPALKERFLSRTASVDIICVVLVAAGLAFAVWARRHLGRNWSGVITLKTDHTLIRGGPYALVRHPIYSGLLLALLGTAIAIGEWRALLALALATGAILLRVGAEDALMAEAFGHDYADYRRRTKALIPFLL
jgi:protein-S-isoprenylcysteine O-methyltransferase Ste14